MQIPGFGIQTARKLIHRSEVKDASEIFELPVNQLLKIDGIGNSKIKALSDFSEWEKADQIISKSEKLGASLISFTDPEYPPMLKQIYDPPVLIWIKGDPAALQTEGIAVVGTRNPGRYGREQAEIWSRKIIENGLSVNSGLAYGVDSVAHRTAVKTGGRTVGVLGSGIDWIYPEKNRSLASDMINNGGAIITEYPPGTKPDAVNFPERNRIVSGMSHGVLVVESGIKGGSMITARTALDQNREVFVVPHPLNYLKGEGCNYLIRTGQGKLIQNFQDITDELSIDVHSDAKEKKTDKKTWSEMDLTGEAASLCELLQDKNLHLDELAELTNKPVYKLLPLLLDLEMQGAVRQKAGKYFELC